MPDRSPGNANGRIRNGHEIRAIGMSRSGNHAIINWILAQSEGRWCHLNCVEPGLNPFTSARPAQGRTWRANFSMDMMRERAGEHATKDLLLYNYEDCFLGLLDRADGKARCEAHVGRSARRTDLLILRDPFNLFASRKQGIESPVSSHVAIRIWKQHARAALEGSRYLGATVQVVFYNRWVCERTYRASVAKSLGLPFTDAGRKDVAHCGGGSSFDALRYDGEADRMDVFNRWRHFAADDEFRATFDRRTVELCQRLSEDLPDTARLPLIEAVDSMGLASGAGALRAAA